MADTLTSGWVSAPQTETARVTCAVTLRIDQQGAFFNSEWGLGASLVGLLSAFLLAHSSNTNRCG